MLVVMPDVDDLLSVCLIELDLFDYLIEIKLEKNSTYDFYDRRRNFNNRFVAVLHVLLFFSTHQS